MLLLWIYERKNAEHHPFVKCFKHIIDFHSVRTKENKGNRFHSYRFNEVVVVVVEDVCDGGDFTVVVVVVVEVEVGAWSNCFDDCRRVNG